MGAQIGVLVLATSGVQLAVGFFGTFISLRVPLENFAATMSAPLRRKSTRPISVMNPRRRI